MKTYQSQSLSRWPPVLSTALVALVLVALVGCEAPFSAERQYLSTMFRHARRTLATVNDISDLASQAEMGNETWERRMGAELAKLRGLIAEARQITPPPRFASFHPAYMDIINTLESMADLYDQAVALRNNQQLQKAQRLLEQTRQRIEEIQVRLQELRSEPE